MGRPAEGISVDIKPSLVTLHGHPMAPSRKTRGQKTRAPEAPTVWKLPMDLLREIIARSNHRTLVRCAATCKLLRREILSPPFERRVIQAAPCILAYLWDNAKQPLTLVHPTTPAALSLCYKHLLRFISRKFATLLDKYEPVSSRRGHVIFHRLQSIEKRPKKFDDSCFDLCVYDPMSGTQTFFSNPPRICSKQYCHTKYVVLTAADGINSSFLMIVINPDRDNIEVRTASICGKWNFECYVSNSDFPWGSLKKHGDPAILSGGVIHWLPCCGNKILSYRLGTWKTGLVELPPTNCDVNYDGNQLYLATSPDRKLLKLLSIQGFINVWLQLPGAVTGGSGWTLEAVIDMEEKLRSLDPNITGGPDEHIEFEGSGKRTGEVVFLVKVSRGYYGRAIFVFDLEMNKMQKKPWGVSFLEIDLPSRLQAMKIFS